MNRAIKYLLLICFLFTSGKAFAWGFWAHQRVNRLAVFTLPPEMLVLYKTNLGYLTEHAVDPDKRRYAMDNEAENHYIDIDHYGEYPFPEMPRQWEDAKAKYSEDSLRAYGIVPWNTTKVYYALVKAFREKNLRRILKLSADIGHYIADSNVPLHTTENYNGQFTGQRGIHGLWESRLPELFGENWDFFVGKARYLDDPLDEMWDAVLESHAGLDSVLAFEAVLTEKMPSDKKYSFENRGASLAKVYSYEFSRNYHRTLAGQVERRMRTSIIRVGSFWYSAWIDAGQPDLKDLIQEELEEIPDDFEKKKKIIDRESGDIGSIEIPTRNNPYQYQNMVQAKPILPKEDWANINGECCSHHECD